MGAPHHHYPPPPQDFVFYRASRCFSLCLGGRRGGWRPHQVTQEPTCAQVSARERGTVPHSAGASVSGLACPGQSWFRLQLHADSTLSIARLNSSPGHRAISTVPIDQPQRASCDVKIPEVNPNLSRCRLSKSHCPQRSEPSPPRAGLRGRELHCESTGPGRRALGLGLPLLSCWALGRTA